MKRIRIKAYCLLLIMLCNILAPIPGWALSGGNKAPEFESYTPFTLDNMVDPATGDFSYNIPLMNIGFHGINLAYQAGITMDQEATMVGLGWNINSGMIDRNVRGIPDDFNGDEVVKEKNMKPNVTFGFGPGVAAELFGCESEAVVDFDLKFGVSYNTYNGFGFEYSLGPSFDIKMKNDNKLTAGVGITGSTDGGITLNPSLSYKSKYDEKEKKHNSITTLGGSINSKSGLSSLSLGTSTKLFEKTRLKSVDNLSKAVSFSKPSYIQDVEFPMSTKSYSLKATVGGELFGLHGGVAANGYYNKQSLATKKMAIKAFGMMYHEECPDDGLQDFHRNGDIPQSEKVPNLAVPTLDFDVYSLSGPGMSGTLQLNRGDLGLVYDRTGTNTSVPINLGVEAGAGNLVHLGIDLGTNILKDEVKKWTNDNDFNLPFSFKSSENNQHKYEKAFLNKVDDEVIEIPNSNDFFSMIKNKELIRPNVKHMGAINSKVDGTVTSDTDQTNNYNFSGKSGKRNTRLKRSNNVTYKTYKEAKLYGFSKYLTEVYSNLNGIAKDHHIAEIIVENEDGYKYIYGIPVYNLKQKEQSFSVDYNQSNELASKNTGVINFTNGIENTTANTKGDDHFFSSTETPAYVSTYLLTAIISKDYQDITNNGPSPDDYGDYVKFDYEKKGTYNWKTPTSQNGSMQASLNLGFITDKGDDKGHVIYGEREQYRPSSIRNKTEIAEYAYYSGRSDGKDETINGIRNENRIGVLKSITKYSLHDHTNHPNNAEKIKSAYFEYDYSSCPGVYNNTGGGGKLTLKKVYILNGESDKGKFSPYEFSYYADNTSYSPKAVNRWGGYQPRHPYATVDSNLISNNTLSNSDFPYVPQNNRSSQDHFASIWNLNKIKLPSGGEIHVKYEADDYAYVQDKNAMQMVKIKGFSQTITGTIDSLLTNRNYLHFDITDVSVISKLNAASSTQHKEILKSYYLNNILENGGQLYYKVLGRLKPDGAFHDLMANEAVWEYVPGWAQLDANDYGILSNSGSYSGYVKLKETCIENRTIGCLNNINSIQKTLMQALRLNLPGYLYGTQVNDPDTNDESVIIDAILGLTSIFQQVVQVVSGGVNNWMYIKNYGNMVDLDKSFIRLYCPSKKKISGSCRVSHIAMIDNFETMTGGVHKNGVYGKKYEYTTTENILNEAVEISSGVAAYEPNVGRDENPFYMPKFFDEKVLFAPDNSKYQEDPLMEDYFPGPQIVYSKVITKDLYLPFNNTIGSVFDFDMLDVYENTGYTENQFYTYKDFPIQVDETKKVHAEPYKIKNIVPLNLFTREYYTAAQGYSLTQYMMHGKPKATYVYDSQGSRISGQESHYKTNSSGLLDYNVKALVYENNDLIIKDGRMGLEYKLFADTREHLSKIKTIGIQGNMEVTGVFPFIGFVPTAIPEYSDGETRFRSIVLVKTIRQQPILYKTVAINGTSEISTEHLLWDAETAQPIVSQTYNEFGDPVYQVNLPAHLAYKGMGLAYQNSGASFTNVNADEGVVASGSVGNNTLINAATEGDKLIFHTSQNSGEYWVLRKTNNSLYLIDKNGSPARFANANVKIDDSGYSNQAGAALASYITKKNPIVGNKLVLDEAKEIIDANATTYKEKWQTYCESGLTGKGSANDSTNTCDFSDGIVNPFLVNIKGQWRPEKSYVFQTDRKSSNNIRVDGPYITKADNYNNTFINFWKEQNGLLVPNIGKWTWTTENTLVSPFGMELEARDPLSRYSAELSGYNHQKTVAVAANARYNQIAYYGAEVPLENGVDIYGLNGREKPACRPKYHINITDGIRKKYNEFLKPNSGEYYLEFDKLKTKILDFGTTPISDAICEQDQSGPYNVQECDCIPAFKPTVGKKYLISAWIKDPSVGNETGTMPYLEVKIDGTTFNIKEYGPVIEGWRKISGSFELGNNAQSGSLSIKGNSGKVLLDDIRIHPYHATMKTYNYDLKTLRFTFEHDDNNFFTRYDYAKDGTLQRVSKQTERGIQTLQESSFGQHKTF